MEYYGSYEMDPRLVYANRLAHTQHKGAQWYHHIYGKAEAAHKYAKGLATEGLEMIRDPSKYDTNKAREEAREAIRQGRYSEAEKILESVNRYNYTGLDKAKTVARGVGKLAAGLAIQGASSALMAGLRGARTVYRAGRSVVGYVKEHGGNVLSKIGEKASKFTTAISDALKGAKQAVGNAIDNAKKRYQVSGTQRARSL